MDTVENIGISCNLLSYDEKIFKIKISTQEVKNDDVSEEPSIEIQNFLSEFRTFLEISINNNNKNNINIYQIKNKKSENYEKSSMNLSDLNYEFLSDLKEKNLINDFSIIIESPLLNNLFRDDELTEKFLTVAQYASTVLCCRASPFQKSQVVQKIKKFNPKAITLAIGDGRNDISMLMEANIGVGIFGEEGVSAAEAADFAIGEFKLLKRLLFFHGRANMNRISKMITYFFIKISFLR
jgi:magnesium-transporting ATPase (P-type)